MLYAMLYGTVPFKANNMHELHKLIMKAKYSLKEDVSEGARDLLKRLLAPDPKKRVTIPEIFAHPWMGDIDENFSLFTDAEKEGIAKEFTYKKKNVDNLDDDKLSEFDK